VIELRSLANIHDQRRAVNFPRLHGQFGEAGDQFDGKIVNAVEAEIFKGFEH
jgi:hypothetical protein